MNTPPMYDPYGKKKHPLETLLLLSGCSDICARSRSRGSGLEHVEVDLAAMVSPMKLSGAVSLDPRCH